MKDSTLIALRVLSWVAENLKLIEKKIDDRSGILLDAIDRIEARIAKAQKDFDVKWYEIDDKDRLAAQVTGRSNMEF